MVVEASGRAAPRARRLGTARPDELMGGYCEYQAPERLR
jgi:hypothetical protein